jgi:hypothetical protein
MLVMHLRRTAGLGSPDAGHSLRRPRLGLQTEPSPGDRPFGDRVILIDLILTDPHPSEEHPHLTIVYRLPPREGHQAMVPQAQDLIDGSPD